jgi:hypothetical protein
MTAAPHNHPTNSDLHRCECSAMADLLSLVLPPAYGPKVQLSWDLTIMVKTIIGPPAKSVVPTNHVVHLPLTRPSRDRESIYCAHVLPVL